MPRTKFNFSFIPASPSHLHYQLILHFFAPLTFIIFLAAIFIFLTPTSIRADFTEDFSLLATTSAQVTSEGKTTISTDFTLTNLTATKYLPEYILQFNTAEITNASVKPADTKDKISVNAATSNSDDSTVSNPNQTLLTLTFETEKLGEGKTRAFTLTYEAPQAAKITGQTLNLTLPQPIQSAQFAPASSLKISLPAQFGEAAAAYPDPTSSTTSDQTITYIYNPLPDTSPQLRFGHLQTYRLTAIQTLHNYQTTPANQQIILPPDTPWQTLNYLSFQPQPLSIIQGAGQNLVATYTVPPQSDLLISYQTEFNLQLAPDENFPAKPDTTYVGLSFEPGLNTAENDESANSSPQIQTWTQNEDLNHFTLALQDAKFKPKLEPLPNLLFETVEISQPPLTENTTSENQDLKPPLPFQLTLEPHFNIILSAFGFRALALTNLTGSTFSNLELQPLIATGAPELNFNSPQLVPLPPLLPFQTQKHIIRITPQNWLSPTFNYEVTLPVEIQTHDRQRNLKQDLSFQLFAPQLAALAGGVCAIALITGGLLVFRRSKKSSLRR